MTCGFRQQATGFAAKLSTAWIAGAARIIIQFAAFLFDFYYDFNVYCCNILVSYFCAFDYSTSY